MSHSIEQQLNRAIYDNFAKGESKHSYKNEHGGDCGAKIFSYSQLNSMKDVQIIQINLVLKNAIDQSL